MYDTTKTSESHDPFGPLAVTNDQYSAFGYDDTIVMYDPENAECWLQSDTTVDPIEAV